MVVDAAVATRIRALFSGAEQAAALRIVETSPATERTRLQMAMLKNSDGDILRLTQQAQLAEIDFRDVPAQAEYPRRLRTPPGEITEQMQMEDRRDYEAWLRGEE
jgi:hypothetical protein